MQTKLTSKTGNAQIKKQGHTATNQFGSNPDAKAKGRGATRDLSAK